MKLFLSYAHKNLTLAKALADVLTQGGQTVWWDDQLRVGPRWQDQLTDQIQRADAIVLALTPEWLASPYCQWEFITAAELGKQVIPVLLTHYPDGTKLIVPNRISQHQWADFTEGFGNSNKVQKFLDDLLTLKITLKPADASHLNKEAYTNAINQQHKQTTVSGGQIGAVENYGAQTNNFGPQVNQTNQSGHNFNVSGRGTVVAGGNIDQRRTHITTHGPISGGNVLIGSEQHVGRDLIVNGTVPATDDSRKHLQALIAQLNTMLAKLPPHQQEAAEDVAVLAQEVVTEASKEKPKATILQIKGAGLVQAANNLLTVEPIAIEIARVLTGIR